jgi:hypothetical protein
MICYQCCKQKKGPDVRAFFSLVKSGDSFTLFFLVNVAAFRFAH